MDKIHGRASLRVDATSQAVFDLITDVDRLPEWNTAIEKVLERPPGLAEGVEWTVKMHPPRMPSWTSISRVEALDRHHLRFAYETRNGDGNPSRAKWAWEVTGAGGGAEVNVTWDVDLKTADRRYFGGPIRKRQLAREVPKSLTAMANTVTARGPEGTNWTDEGRGDPSRMGRDHAAPGA